MSLSLLQLPFSTAGPPDGFGWEDRSESDRSTSTAFATNLKKRDYFLGEKRCIVCGSRTINYCHIIGTKEDKVWEMLKQRNWVPGQAKSQTHEPRNGLLMCPNHQMSFDDYDFFIRFVPGRNKFVFIDYTDPPDPDLQAFHGKDLPLDVTHRHAPFPSTLLIHEQRVRGFHPFLPPMPPMPPNPAWQDWIVNDHIFDQNNDFSRHGNSVNDNSSPNQSDYHQLQLPPQSQSQPQGRLSLELNQDVVNNILAATHAMPSWKWCQIEGTSWSGTADENMKKYNLIMGDH